jgi:hypothetical protein
MAGMSNGRTLSWIAAFAGLAFCVSCASAPRETPAPDALRHVERSAFWQRSGRTVLGGFDNMYHSSVLQVADRAYPYRMWFMGWAAADCNPGYPGCDAIFLARGKSLDTWEVYAGDDTWDTSQTPSRWVPVLTANTKPYDAWHNGDPSVVFHDGRYYMAYSATGPDADGVRYGEPGDTDGDLYCVMGAVSDDGIHWRRSVTPLAINPSDIGAAGDRATDAVIGGMYHRPSLMFDQGHWRLWFDYWLSNGVAMGYAEGNASEFLQGNFHIVRAGNEPLLPEWPNPSVVKAGGKYYCFSDPSGYGVGWAGRQLAEAESRDGIHWNILGYLPPDADTPACQVPSAVVLRDAGRDCLVVFYACQKGGEPYDYRYDRIRYMKRALK